MEVTLVLPVYTGFGQSANSFRQNHKKKDRQERKKDSKFVKLDTTTFGAELMKTMKASRFDVAV